MQKIKSFLKTLGPGFITGASDDDPSGIVTYSQTGALFGFSQLWTSFFTTPLMIAVQEMCGRIGLVTGKGLAGVIREHYSKKILYGAVGLLFIANTINIGADLGAMAASVQMLVNIPFVMLLLGMVVLTLALEIFVSYKTYSAYLKYLTLALFSYIFVAFIVSLNWLEILSSTLIPHIELNSVYIMNIVAILGTTISPYLYFWQASEEVEEEVAHHKLRAMGAGQPKITPRDISQLRKDTIIGMVFSNIVMFFIIAATAATLFANGIHSIENAQQAALALKPIAGDFAFFLFAIGIIGTGFLTVPILAGSASYALSETFGWKAGLSEKLQKAHGFYGAITIATLIGLLINFIGVDPIVMLYYTAMINGIIAPPLLIIILFIANNKKIMGDRVNSRSLNVLGVVTISIMTIAALLLISTWIY